MWIATNGGGVTQVRDGQFRTYKTGDYPWTNRVNAVMEDHAGTVWCGADEGVFRIRGDSAEPFHAERHFIGVASVVGNDDGLVWISSPYHLYFYDPRHDDLQEFDSHLRKGAVYLHLWKRQGRRRLGLPLGQQYPSYREKNNRPSHHHTVRSGHVSC